MNKLNRRNFLRSSVIGAGSALIAGPAYSASSLNRGGEKVITRTLGKTGLEIPVLSMGVMRADNPSLVKAAFNSGVTFFDTAHGYQKGQNEVMLGEFFKDIPRDKFMIQTKVPPGDRNNETGEYGPGATKESFLERFELSLKRLQMDYVDIFLHHGARGRAGVMHEPVLEALQEIKKKGKARFIGISTHMWEPEAIRASMETGIMDVVTVAYNFKQDHREEISAAMAEAAEAGIGFIGMKTMAGGYMDKEKQIPVNGRAALKWAFRDPNITTCIPGFTSFEQFDDDLGIMQDLDMTPEEEKDLEIAGNEMGLYCQGCGACTGSCPRNLPVPEIMRAYMYARGYGEMQKAYDTLEEYQVQADPCRSCEECRVFCSKGFPVKERIAYVSRLKDIPSEFLT